MIITPKKGDLIRVQRNLGYYHYGLVTNFDLVPFADKYAEYFNGEEYNPNTHKMCVDCASTLGTFVGDRDKFYEWDVFDPEDDSQYEDFETEAEALEEKEYLLNAIKHPYVKMNLKIEIDRTGEDDTPWRLKKLTRKSILVPIIGNVIELIQDGAEVSDIIDALFSFLPFVQKYVAQILDLIPEIPTNFGGFGQAHMQKTAVFASNHITINQ